MGKSVYLTKDGYERLQAKYNEYVNFRRGDASEKIRIAREYGDLSENAEYDAAKEEQAMIESEIKLMEDQLANVVIIDEVEDQSRHARIGSKVTIKGDNGTHTYEIVGSTEASIKTNPIRISNESPVSKAIMGKNTGDSVVVHTPLGFKKFEIIKVDNN